MAIKSSTLFLFVTVIASVINITTITYFYFHQYNHGNDNDFSVVLSGGGGNIAGKEEIISILQRSGVTLTDELIESMPTMYNFTSMYGSNVQIIGLETCKGFQEKISPLESLVGPAGLYNTGTNLVYHLMVKHCILPERVAAYDQLHKSEDGNIVEGNNNEPVGVRTGIFDEVPWGKHGPVSWRDDESYRPESFKINQAFTRIESKNIFPIVMVKDPYSWMGSMCRHPYSSLWLRSPQSCLNLNKEYDRYDIVHGLTDPNRKVRRKRNPSSFLHGGIKFNTPKEQKKRKQVGLIIEYESSKNTIRWRREKHYENVVDLWNTFYSDYINVTFPRLIVRYEDLLLHADKVIPQICDCVGGKLVNLEPNGITLSKDSAKNKEIHGDTSDLIQSFLRYGSSKLRVSDFSKGDLVYSNEELSKELMEIFQYTYPKLDYDDKGIESVI